MTHFPLCAKTILNENAHAARYLHMASFILTPEEFRHILALKRDLHMHPELSGREHRTTGKIREFLSAIPGVELLPLAVETGVLARLQGSCPGPEILLRADIDALPQKERYESPWKSRTEGVMHACGHDFHTASLLGAVPLLSHARECGSLGGAVDFLFQPAEEGTTGARSCIDAGLFSLIHPSRCYGMHNWPSVPAGTIVLHEGPLMSAKRNFTIRLYGSGGHGSMPHLNVDPIVCAAAVIESLQTVISRNINPLDSAILSINMIRGGSPVNLVVEEVELRATVRSLSEEALSRAISRAETIICRTAEAYECRAEIEWKERIPLLANTKEMLAEAEKAAELVRRDFLTASMPSAQEGFAPGAPDVPGGQAGPAELKEGCLLPELADAPPSLASEDFALYRSFVPSFFYWIGSNVPGDPVEELHRPAFHTDDRALSIAASLYARSVVH